MKNVLDLLETFTEYEWKRAKKEMAKRIPSMNINEMSMDEFKVLTKYLASPDFENIDDYRRRLH
jgi:hypothetical protein|tara:strand:+ start:438 stop:629 length:192 start_codon:yes stop_codon:yes gene_type:complete